MSESDVATRAPESDAAGSTSILGDTRVDQGASMGAYVTKPSDYPHSPSKLLLFLTSGTGIHSTNNQLQADKYASEGFLVVMPDLSVYLPPYQSCMTALTYIQILQRFAGDPAPNSSDNENQVYQEDNPSLIEQFKMRAAETAKSFVIDMWLARQTPAKVLPIIHRVIEATKEEFADAAANGGGVYAVGYCFGAKYVLTLAGDHPDTVLWGQAPKDEEEGVVKNGPVIKAGAIAHGTLVTIEDMTALKAPVSMACVENDQVFSDEVREEGRKHLETNNVEHEIKVYPEVPHGFAVVGDYKEPAIQEAQRLAFDQMLSWLKAH
ncbi:MAG: hypothetical protein M1837_000241 [Sclerophora amabilis]|nr:MAG: hypothetical protein M1837_000241 [Sclerophora amabilis]